MTETPKEAARRFAGSMLAKGYRPEALHEYTDRDGNTLYYRIRLTDPDTGDKWIRPTKLVGDTYVLGEPAFPNGKPLYSLHRLHKRPHETVYLVEGEKCADELEKLGLLATTSGSADSFENADWTALVERDSLYVRQRRSWATLCGRRFPEACGTGLQPKQISIHELALPAKGDCVDWINRNVRLRLLTFPPCQKSPTRNY